MRAKGLRDAQSVSGLLSVSELHHRNDAAVLAGGRRLLAAADSGRHLAAQGLLLKEHDRHTRGPASLLTDH